MITLVTKPSGFLVGMLGTVEAGAIIERPDGEAMWLFYLPRRGPMIEVDQDREWKKAASVEAARVAIEEASKEWLRAAGVLGDDHQAAPQPPAPTATDDSAISRSAFDEFHSAVRIIWNITAMDLEQAGLPREDWSRFMSAPLGYFIRSATGDAEKLWAFVERRLGATLSWRAARLVRTIAGLTLDGETRPVSHRPFRMDGDDAAMTLTLLVTEARSIESARR